VSLSLLVRIDRTNIDTNIDANTYTDANMNTKLALIPILILILILYYTIFCYFIGILPLMSSAESWIKIPRSIPELKSALKGILFAPSPPSTTQYLLLIIFILSLIVVLLCMYMSNKSNKKTERKEHGGYEYPVNCVHGYVNLDAAGNLLPKDSTQPPR
jgi:flagellar basal body-associated protein FliL